MITSNIGWSALGEYRDRKEEASAHRRILMDAETFEENQSEEEAKGIIGSVVKYGLTLEALVLANRALKNKDVQQKVERYTNLSYLADSIKGNKQDALKIFGGGKVTLANLSMNVARAFEELSPFSILRTFNTSHILTPFATAESEFDFSTDLLKAQKRYFSHLASKYGERQLTDADFNLGLKYSKGQLLDNSGEVVIKNARLTLTEFAGTEPGHSATSSYNKILRRHVAVGEGANFLTRREVGDLARAVPTEVPFTIIAANKDASIGREWMKSVIGQAVAQGFNMVNEPLGFLEETGGTIINQDSTLFKLIRKYGRINPNATSESTIKELAIGYAKHGTMKLAALAAGFYALDNASKVIGTDDSGYGKGIAEGLSTTFLGAKLLYAETVSDRFEEYRQEQEYVAPGSTSLLKLAGFPLAGAMFGGTIAYGRRTLPAVLANDGYIKSTREAAKESFIFGRSVATLASGTVVDHAVSVGTRAKRFATRGAAIGALFALPFLPGALVGESSGDIRAEYLEGKDVAIRKNRGWFSSSTPIEGEGIKYYTKNWYQRLMAGNKDKILYGDNDTKEDLNPFLSPLDYLRNPYQFEQMHQGDMPYPVWGMDVSMGGWVGRGFQMAFGDAIKLDLINPRMEALTQELGGTEGGEPSIIPSLSITQNISNKQMSLIGEGKSTYGELAKYDPNTESANYIVSSGLDFIGLKGWAASGALKDFGLGIPELQTQYARSGEATNIAREFEAQNLGGMGGAADVIRRIIPMSADVTGERFNPLKNTAAPDWLPSQGYFNDFSRGAFWDKVENGYDRLPGKGYETWNPELSGIDPNDYPDINKFEILSDVAFGSNEYYKMYEKMEDMYRRKVAGEETEMSDEDAAKFEDIYIQSQERSRKRRFFEYKTDADMEGISMWGRLLGSMWESTTHNAELSTERLTFFRPAGKLLHQRTAIEDYVKTQLSEGDTALWDKPYKHFIRPFVEDSYKYIGSEHVPEYIQERRNVNNYFDALEYYKQMQIYRKSAGVNDYQATLAKQKAGRTVYGAVASGLDSRQDVESAYGALSDNERAYFSSFVNANESDRGKISRIVDDNNTADMYRMLWARKDAIDNGDDVGALIQQEEQDLIDDNRSAYQAYQNSGDRNIGISFREYVQELRAASLIEEATGIPTADFAGWDPRIEIKDVKLRALQLSKEDVREYGFWKSDEEDLARQTYLLNEDQVTTQLGSIKETRARREFQKSLLIKDQLMKQGIFAKDIRFSNTGFGDQDINIG
jgi:virion structural protein